MTRATRAKPDSRGPGSGNAQRPPAANYRLRDIPSASPGQRLRAFGLGLAVALWLSCLAYWAWATG